MTELFDELNDKAWKVSTLMVADIVDDEDLLTVALCAGNLNEIARTLHANRLDVNKQEAAHRALELGLNSKLRNNMASKGFFAKGLRGLLELAQLDSDTGSRLMPIFNELVTAYKKYRIPRDLRVCVKNYMTNKKNTDGFAIMCIDDANGRTLVYAADWVSDMLLD
jgi:hypothetical protein